MPQLFISPFSTLPLPITLGLALGLELGLKRFYSLASDEVGNGETVNDEVGNGEMGNGEVDPNRIVDATYSLLVRSVCN